MQNVPKFLFFLLLSVKPLDIFFDSQTPGPQFFGNSTFPYQNFDDFIDYAQNPTNFHLKFINSIYNCSKMANLTSNWTFSNFLVSPSFSQFNMYGNCQFYLNNNTLLIFEQFDIKMKNSASFYLGWNSNLILKNCQISCFFHRFNEYFQFNKFRRDFSHKNANFDKFGQFFGFCNWRKFENFYFWVCGFRKNGQKLNFYRRK